MQCEATVVSKRKVLESGCASQPCSALTVLGWLPQSDLRSLPQPSQSSRLKMNAGQESEYLPRLALCIFELIVPITRTPSSNSTESNSTSNQDGSDMSATSKPNWTPTLALRGTTENALCVSTLLTRSAERSPELPPHTETSFPWPWTPLAIRHKPTRDLAGLGPGKSSLHCQGGRQDSPTDDSVEVQIPKRCINWTVRFKIQIA